MDELDTPALCLDLDRFESNVAHMAEACRQHGIGWRPHAKCHKSTDVGTRLVAAGALGLTCAKLGEAEVMAEAGVQDLLIANLIVGPAKVARLVQLRQIADPIVCIDHLQQAEPISRAMAEAGLRQRVIIEVDIGLHRVGVAPERTLPLAQQLHALPGLDLAGIMGYEGHLLTVEDQAAKQQQIEDALAILARLADDMRQAGLPCPIVSCGGTGSFRFAAAQPGITEVQAGGAIFMDEFYRHKCQVEGLQQALTVLATVVSRPAPERAIVDAGRKSINGEIHMPAVADRPGVTVQRLSAEHGALHISPEADPVNIGDRLHLIPGYADLTTVLHDCFYCHRQGRLEAIWPLQARGRLQ